MNLALSILSTVASTAEAVASRTAEVTAEATQEAPGVIDRLQAYEATGDLSIAQQQIADPDYWSSVGIITLTGMLVVFAILGLLIFLFWGMGKAFDTIDKNKKLKAEAAKSAAAPAVQAAPVVEEEEELTDDDEVIAVISAAIAAYSEQDGKSYEIRSIRRKDSRTRSAWSLAGIGDNTRPF